MSKKKTNKIVDYMYLNDEFSKWLGISIEKVELGTVTLSMIVRGEMLNGFNIAHGGITYSLADTALAFASNSHGRKSVSIETSISHTLPCKNGDVLTAVATEKSKSNKVAIYDIEITNQHNELVALFKGTVYITTKYWEF